MKFFLYLIMFTLIVISFGCVSTQQSNDLNKLSKKEIQAYNNDPNNTDRIECRNEEVIGSRMPKRVCKKTYK